MGWLSKAWNAVTGTIKAIISNPVTAIAAVGLAIYAPALGLRMLGTMMVSNVLNAITAKDSKSPTDGASTNQQGSSQVLPFSTTNKLPIVYGSAFLSGFLTDAKISTDNQTMWYVISVCEAPDSGEASVTFGDMYWNEQKITFSSSEYGRVTKLTNNAGQEDGKVDGNLWIYPYSGSSTPLLLNGLTSTVSAITRLQDTAIPADARWTGTQAMTGTVFYIVKCVYSTDDNMTGLGALLAQINVEQTGVTGGYRPGAAMIDYLTNDRYGAGLDADRVYAQSFADLDSYSDVLINFTQFGGGSTSQPRYRFNGVVDTTQTVMSNLMAMADSCDAYIQFNEARGQWAVIANKSVLQYPNIQTYNDLFSLDDTNIIGGVNIIPLDLNSTPNEVESGYSDGANRGRMNYAYASTPENLKSINEPVNKLSITYKFVNDSVRAQYLSNRKLEQCRADYIVQLTADYSAIQIDAGDVVTLTYKPYGNNLNGWGDNKLFRVTQVTENRADNGDLTVNLSLMEYAEAVYDDRNITEFEPPSGGVVLDPRLLAKPGTPTFPGADIKPSANPPSFVVQSEIPRSGITVGMEFWYGPTQEITNNNYILYNTEYNSAGNQYPISAQGAEVYEKEFVSGLPEGTLYWRTRAIGTTRKSEFSDPAEIIWAPVTTDSTIGDASGAIKKNNLPVAFVDNPNWPTGTRGIVPSGGVLCMTTANPGSIRIDFSVGVYAEANSEYNCVEVWKQTSSEVHTTKFLSVRHSYDFTDSTNSSLHSVQCVGTNGADYKSDDGGQTWNQSYTTSSVHTWEGQIPYYASLLSGNLYYQTLVVGDFSSFYGNTISLCSGANRSWSTPSSTGTTSAAINNSGTTSGASIFTTDTANISHSFNDVTIGPGSGGASGGGVGKNCIFAVASNGEVYKKTTSSTANPDTPSNTTSNWTKETTNGTLQPLTSIYFNNGSTYTGLIVGGFSTILRSTRTGTSTASWTGRDVLDFDGSTLVSHLYCVAGDNSNQSTTSVWVAVGEKGTIISSLDDGQTWTRREFVDGTGVQQYSHLYGVRYGNGKWVAVGAGGTIVTSTDAITWTLIQPTLTTRNLYSVDWCPTNGRFNAAGDGIVINSVDTTILFAITLNIPPSENTTLERIWYKGSNPDVRTSTVVPVQNRLVNGQTLSSTVYDTDYVKSDDLIYYLIVGNLNKKTVYADNPVISAVEYKR
jgi:hypothetical protein